MSSPDPNSPRLTQDNLNELAQARLALRKIRRAVFAARFEGYTIAIFGGLSLLFSITSPRDFLISLPFAVVGVIEIWGAGQLRRLRTQAISILTLNQLSLAALILLYALAKLYVEIHYPTSNSSIPGLSSADEQAIDQIQMPTLANIHVVYMLLYVCLIPAALIEAAMAHYYHTRGRFLQNYLAQTPAWIIAMQRQGISV